MDWIAAVFGVTGSIFLSMGRRDLVPYTFLFYLIGSACWIVFGLTSSIYSLVMSSSIFFVIECIGLYRWTANVRFKEENTKVKTLTSR